jgi:hypothetical protein
MADVAVTVVLSESADSAVVTERLRTLGVTVTFCDELLGVLTGHCEEPVIEQLCAVPGVVSVERGRQFQLPDPAQPQ